MIGYPINYGDIKQNKLNVKMFSKSAIRVISFALIIGSSGTVAFASEICCAPAPDAQKM